MNRTEARDYAFKTLFQLEVKEPLSLNEARQFVTEEQDDFLTALLDGATNHQAAIDEAITPHLKNWKLERLSKADRIILRIAVYEILFTDIPDKVAVNEAVELSKQYGDDDSYKFVNGVLSEVIKLKA